MISSLIEGSCCSNEHTGCQKIQASIISGNRDLAGATSSEVLASGVGHIGTDSGVTFKRVTYSSRSIGSWEQIGFMHSATVTATWGGGGPRMENLFSSLDRHAVSSFDLFNKIPSNSDLFGWINNFDALIKEQNVGLQKEQIRSHDAAGADSTGQNQVSAIDSGLNNKTGEENNHRPATSNGTTRSKSLTIRHSVSFSQMGSIK